MGHEHLTKEDMWVATKHMKRCSMSSTIRNIQLKIMKRDHCTSVRMAKTKGLTMPSAAKDVEQLKRSRATAVECRNSAAALDTLWQGLSFNRLIKICYIL